MIRQQRGGARIFKVVLPKGNVHRQEGEVVTVGPEEVVLDGCGQRLYVME